MASSSSSSPEISAAPTTIMADNSSNYTSLDDALDDLSRWPCARPHHSLLPHADFLLPSRFILNLPESELSSVERVCFQVEQACVPHFVMCGWSLISSSTVIGSTRISSEKQTPSSPHYHSRSFLKPSSVPAPFCTAGAPISKSPSTTSCNTKPEFLSAVRSCWTTHGRRYVDQDFARLCRL